MPRKAKGGGDLFLRMKINQIPYVSLQFLFLNLRFILPWCQAWHNLGRRKDGDNHRQGPLQFSWMVLSLFSEWEEQVQPQTNLLSAIAPFGMEERARITPGLMQRVWQQELLSFWIPNVWTLDQDRIFLHGSKCKVCTAVSKWGICCSSGASRHSPCPSFLARCPEHPQGSWSSWNSERQQPKTKVRA